MENKRTEDDLKIMQSWPLERKIRVTQTRIIEWYLRWQGMVYVSFSGGKDSTVLLDLARRIYPDIEAVFVDTGLEYPEIREFVRSKENVTWLYPVKYDRKKREHIRTNFKEVISEYGYPVISKEVAKTVREVRSNPNCRDAQKFNSNSPYVQRYGKRFDLSKWEFLLDSDFKIDDRCCNAMKKIPSKLYEKETGNRCILGTLATESALRKTKWLEHGCNGFTQKRPTSQPISFWTEQDVLSYLKITGIPYCSIYGEIAADNEGQTELFETKRNYQCTGVRRTGCMFCMFGVHLEKEPNRFQRMKITHPKQYTYCISTLGIGAVLDYIGVPYN